MTADTTEMPARYRPDTAGHSRINGSSPRSLSAKVTQGALQQLGAEAGDRISFLPKSDDSLTVRHGCHTGAVATYVVYQPEANAFKDVECSVSGGIISYLGLSAGDRIVYHYPQDRDDPRMVATGVPADE